MPQHLKQAISMVYKNVAVLLLKVNILPLEMILKKSGKNIKKIDVAGNMYFLRFQQQHSYMLENKWVKCFPGEQHVAPQGATKGK